MTGEVAVIGLGASGAAATRLLRRQGRAVYASDRDRSPALDTVAEELRGLGADVELGGHDLDRIARAAACVVSPGVPPDAPPIAAALRAGVPIRAEVDLGLEALRGVRYVGITGTNGKTTTTAMVAHLLEAAGRRAEAVGNYGTPVSEIALRPDPPEWLAVELSSFQLHDMPAVRPTVGVLTNLAPDHLDRYSRIEEYYGDKARLFRNAGGDAVTVSNADDPLSVEMVKAVPGRHLRFSVEREADGWYDRAAGVLRLGAVALLEREAFELPGDHNVANALAAALAVRATGAEIAPLGEGLRSFRPLEHRMEPVRELDGVQWINDSKATNISSTDVALAAMTRPFVLLLGGRHKGEPYTRLLPRLEGRCRGVVAYGEALPLILQDLGGARVPLQLAQSFSDAMDQARALARPGDAVLLSPACSSYDMFDNYGQRGRSFRRIVESW